MRFAGSNSFKDAYSTVMSDVPDYTGLSTVGMDASSAERRNNIQSELQVHGAGLDSMAEIKSAAHQARGIEAGGQAQAAATRASGFSSTIGGIAGGIGKMDFGGGGGGGYDFSSPAWTTGQSKFGNFFRSQ